MRISPELGGVRPETSLRTVDLPQPEGPIMLRNSPFATVRLSSSRMTRSYFFDTLRSSICGTAPACTVGAVCAALVCLLMLSHSAAEDKAPKAVPRREKRTAWTGSSPMKLHAEMAFRYLDCDRRAETHCWRSPDVCGLRRRNGRRLVQVQTPSSAFRPA